jgi:hypothetical protein
MAAGSLWEQPESRDGLQQCHWVPDIGLREGALSQGRPSHIECSSHITFCVVSTGHCSLKPRPTEGCYQAVLTRITYSRRAARGWSKDNCQSLASSSKGFRPLQR